MDNDAPERYIDSYDVIDVEVLRTGEFKDMYGNKLKVDVEMLDELEKNYDPEHVEGKVSLDHQWGGAAWLGRIANPRRKGDKLLCDFTGVPTWIARGMLRDGDWPCRSCEIFKNMDGRGRVLTNVTLLGVAVPAVRGLKYVTEDQLKPNYKEVPNDIAEVEPASAFSFSETPDGVIRFGNATPAAGDGQPQEIPENTEVPRMADKPNEDMVPLTEMQALQAQLDEANAQLAAANETLDKVTQEAESDKEEKVQMEAKLADATSQVASANERLDALEADKVRLMHERMHDKNTEFVNTLLKEKGGVVAPLAQYPVADLLTALDTNGKFVLAGDGEKVEKDLGEAVRELLSALPTFDGHLELVSAEEKPSHGLSAAELEQCKANNITPEQYAEIKARNEAEGVIA